MVMLLYLLTCRLSSCLTLYQLLALVSACAVCLDFVLCQFMVAACKTKSELFIQVMCDKCCCVYCALCFEVLDITHKLIIATSKFLFTMVIVM
jgi:hypothetical protein